MAGVSNTGIVNYVSNPVAVFPENAITIDIFGNTFFRSFSFGAGDDTGVYWSEKHHYTKEQMLFLAIAIQRSLRGKFNFGNKVRSSQSHGCMISLPLTPQGKINLDFMESFIRELEEERIRELEEERIRELSAYLSVSGLDNYELSKEEERILTLFGMMKWKKFNLKSLFGTSTRGKRLKGEDRIPGPLPFVTAGEAEEGVSSFIGNNVEVFSKNTTTIDMFGSAKYRNCNYGADDHIAVVHTEQIPKYAAIFVTTACHKAAHTGEFDYSKNFYAKDADALNIMLPIREDSSPDFASMEILLRAIHKLVIQDVSEYAARHIAATKEATK